MNNDKRILSLIKDKQKSVFSVFSNAIKRNMKLSAAILGLMGLPMLSSEASNSPISLINRGPITQQQVNLGNKDLVSPAEISTKDFLKNNEKILAKSTLSPKEEDVRKSQDYDFVKNLLKIQITDYDFVKNSLTCRQTIETIKNLDSEINKISEKSSFSAEVAEFSNKVNNIINTINMARINTSVLHELESVCKGMQKIKESLNTDNASDQEKSQEQIKREMLIIVSIASSFIKNDIIHYHSLPENYLGWKDVFGEDTCRENVTDNLYSYRDMLFHQGSEIYKKLEKIDSFTKEERAKVEADLASIQQERVYCSRIIDFCFAMHDSIIYYEEMLYKQSNMKQNEMIDDLMIFNTTLKNINAAFADWNKKEKKDLSLMTTIYKTLEEKVPASHKLTRMLENAINKHLFPKEEANKLLRNLADRVDSLQHYYMFEYSEIGEFFANVKNIFPHLILSNDSSECEEEESHLLNIKSNIVNIDKMCELAQGKKFSELPTELSKRLQLRIKDEADNIVLELFAFAKKSGNQTLITDANFNINQKRKLHILFSKIAVITEKGSKEKDQNFKNFKNSINNFVTFADDRLGNHHVSIKLSFEQFAEVISHLEKVNTMTTRNKTFDTNKFNDIAQELRSAINKIGDPVVMRYFELYLNQYLPSEAK